MKHLFVIIILPIYLANCNFKPIYEKSNNIYSLRKQLSLISIESDLSQDGINLKNTLENYLGEIKNITRKEKDYILKLKLKKDIEPYAIQKTSIATRYNVKFSVEYKLIKLSDNTILDESVIEISSSYDVSISEFANFTAENYSTKNNINEISELLINRLNLIFLYENQSNKSS